MSSARQSRLKYASIAYGKDRRAGGSNIIRNRTVGLDAAHNESYVGDASRLMKLTGRSYDSISMIPGLAFTRHTLREKL